jgi:MFS family permease
VYAAMLFVARPLAGKLMDRRGENIVTYPAMLLFAVSFLFLAWAHSGWVLLLAAVLLAFGFGTLYPGMQMIVTKVSPPHRLGLALSTFFICLDAGTGVGGYIIGFIAEWFGFQTTFLMLAAVVLCVIPVYYYVHGRKAGKTTQSAK